MKNKILLSGMEFYAYHGCYQAEKVIGTRFKVDVEITCHFMEAARHDDITQTINYLSVYQEVDKVMSSSVNLLETLAFNIAQQVKNLDASIEKIKVSVYKLNPVLGGKTDWVAAVVED